MVGVDILDGIGSTEMLQTFLSNRPGDIRYGSTGKPVPGYDVKIVDETGQELPPGEIGELVVRGPSAGEGYWNQRAKSRRTFVGNRPIPATSISVTRTATTTAAAAPTTCSR